MPTSKSRRNQGPSADDERARRLTALVLALENARVPLLTSDILSLYYQDDELSGAPSASQQRKFERDRKQLAEIGITLNETRLEGRQAWQIDPACLVVRPKLSREDAHLLRIACSPLVNSPTFPYADDLLFALAKLDGAFDTAPAVCLSPAKLTPRQQLLARASQTHEPIRVSYLTADGRHLTRLLALWGAFSLRGHTYYVAARLDELGRPTSEVPHTYRDDRFEKPASTHLPAVDPLKDFSLSNYLRLPFQLGPKTAVGVFLVPQDLDEGLRSRLLRYGSLDEEHRRWQTSVSDVACAASWAIAEGLRPLEPEALVKAWQKLLEGAISDV